MMTGFEVGIAASFMALAAFVLGALLGHDTERREWISRALPGNSTPHYCDGKFYYIVPEDVFVNEYRRRRIVPPQGGSGTAPSKPTVGPNGGTGTP